MTHPFTIIGSGFGLYGYLPALLNTLATEIILPEKYYEKVMSRAELLPYLNQIKWGKNEQEILPLVDGVVIATIPELQPLFVDQCLRFGNIKYLFAEKPLAPTFSESERLLNLLSNSPVEFRIGFTFLYTPWFEKIKLSLQKCSFQDKLMITWSFRAYHFTHNLAQSWKQYDRQGGGVIKFYGIQVIALLAALGYTQAIESKIEEIYDDAPVKWQAVFCGKELPTCEIEVDSNAQYSIFNIKKISDQKETTLIDAEDPFDEVKGTMSDRRIPVLEYLIKTIGAENYYYYSLYFLINDLWKTVTLSNTHQIADFCKE